MEEKEESEAKSSGTKTEMSVSSSSSERDHGHRLYFLADPEGNRRSSSSTSEASCAFSRVSHPYGISDCSCSDTDVCFCDVHGSVYVLRYPCAPAHTSMRRGTVDAKLFREVSGARKIEFPEGVRIVRVACGLMWTVYLSDVGRVYATGEGVFGFLGLGGRTCASSIDHPVVIPYFDEHAAKIGKVTDIVAGNRMSGVITSSGEAFIWGTRFGGLGASTEETDAREPVSISPYFPADDRRIAKLAIGRDHAAALTSSGRVYVWGSMGDGRLGLGIPSLSELVQWSPRRVPVPPATDIACGDRHTLLCLADGSVMSAGRPLWGRLGRQVSSDSESGQFRVCPPFLSPSCSLSSSNPDRPSVLAKSARAVAAGAECSFVIDSQSTLLSCGDAMCELVQHDAFKHVDSLVDRGVVVLKVAAWGTQCTLLVSEPTSSK